MMMHYDDEQKGRPNSDPNPQISETLSRHNTSFLRHISSKIIDSMRTENFSIQKTVNDFNSWKISF